ncbi:MAG: DUF192 domain-containing protein, partial [Alsobacter sp.]
MVMLVSLIRSRPAWLGLMIALLIAVGVPASAVAQGKVETLVITTSQGARSFEVEVMRTDEERARGLMFRRYMPADRGMLFDFKETQPVMMWMKD